MHDIARFAGVNEPPSDAFGRLRTYHDTMNLWERVIAGTETALRTLAERYRLGVVSNANGTVRKKLERVGLGQQTDIRHRHPRSHLVRAAWEGHAVAPSRRLDLG